ncbi:MAG: hypothetical protein WD015_01130 [Gaiellaceae bacterium]
MLALLASVVAALTLPGTAMATACGDKVLADWFDNGRIDRLYDLHCYEEAIDAIPADLRDYANAEEIISRALQAAVGGDLDPGGPDPTPGDNTGAGPGVPGDPGDPNSSGGEAAPEVDTTGISSIPIPLIVLGGMSIALLGAGGLGYLSRRRAAAHADDGRAGPDDDLLS